MVSPWKSLNFILKSEKQKVSGGLKDLYGCLKSCCTDLYRDACLLKLIVFEATRCNFVAMTNLTNLYWLYSKNSIEARVILHQAAAKSLVYENWLVQMNFDFMSLCHLKVTAMQETKSGWRLSDVGFKVILWPNIIDSIRFFLQTIP